MTTATGTVLHLLETSPIFLFAFVAALGTLIGGVRVRGASVGIAAVLFVGLAVNAWRPSARLPEVLQQLGLVVFVYTIGLASGPGFFSALRARGPRDALLTALVIAFAAAALAMGSRAFLTPAQAAGIFAGSLTNTPALAEVVQFLRDQGKGATGDLAASEAVVAYSVAYPMGVLASLGAVQLALRTRASKEEPPSSDASSLSATTVRVCREEIAGRTLGELRAALEGQVSFGRVRAQSGDSVADDHARVEVGMLVSIVGARQAVDRAVKMLGEIVPLDLASERGSLDYRRMVVSRRALVGTRVSDLPLFERFGAHVTRLRRGDVDFVPTPATTLEPGDRVRVVAPRDRMDEVSKFFGDSIRVYGEVDMITFGLGVGLGVVLGTVTVPLPSGLSFRLGLAGGPLLVGLIAGRLGKTGPLIWSLSGTASTTLRQFGLLLFFAAVGTRAGSEFWRVVQTSEGLRLGAIAVALSVATTLGTVYAARRMLRLEGPALGGLVAGVQTQPAALAMAAAGRGAEQANVAYATVFPVATVAKIVVAQVLLRFLAR